MKAILRAVLSLICSIFLVVSVFTALQVHRELHYFTRHPSFEIIMAAWAHAFLHFSLEAILIVLAVFMIVWWTIAIPIHWAANAIRKLRLGQEDELSTMLPKGVFEPLTTELVHLTRSLASARAAAEAEARLRHSKESLWTAERLRESVRAKLANKPLFVISNREPYMHIRNGRQPQCLVPPSGLVTALEPILRACGGIWIAQATGDADREVVDEKDEIRVPPLEPQYTLRRIWLTPEEERGFYYGFSNEGLWPLCHMAYTRPIFRAEDWESYRRVNAEFARVALEEMRHTAEPYVLIQDYHFGLLPRMIKEERPDARIALFWHIPWPNPEAFRICPWRREMLIGMLGADLLGFHTQYHCNHFLETVDQVLESRQDWERFAVTRQGHTTFVKPFPISVDFRSHPVPTTSDKASLLKELGIQASYLAVGVDRIDYTKGLLERFQAIERFLDKYPAYQEQLTYVELGAPSRSLIKRYEEFVAEVEQEAERINARFRKNHWQPIVLLEKHHSHEEITRFYKAADVCLVTSLHDGMNLVAKEFVAERDDEDGVLILSCFTGAYRELGDALIVNPYDIEQMADALHSALCMEKGERTLRMQRMRQVVRDFNIYRWGASLINELTKIRTPAKELTAR